MRKLTPAHAYIVLHERVVLCACGSTGPWLAAREYECNCDGRVGKRVHFSITQSTSWKPINAWSTSCLHRLPKQVYIYLKSSYPHSVKMNTLRARGLATLHYVCRESGCRYISLVSGRLYQYLASEETLDIQVVLKVVPVFRLCAKTARGALICILAPWLFHAITLNPRAKSP